MLDKKGVGKRIAYYRKEHGMTQKDLAALLNISYQAVSKWEAGISLPTVEMLYDIAKILNMTVDGLLNEEAGAKRQITYMDTGLDTRKLYELTPPPKWWTVSAYPAPPGASPCHYRV